VKRRSKAGGGLTKGRRRKTPEPERVNAPNSQARSKLSPAIEETEVARLTRELTDERRQRTATSEVLRLLSGLHGDLNHLFDTILANATNLCQANFGTLSLCEGDAFRIVAMHNVPPGLAELRRREPLVRAGPLLRMAETKRLLHIADYTEYVASHPADSDAAAFAKLTGVRTALEVPMLKDNDVVGAVVIYRTEVRRFDDREMALIQDFAAQAVIAIENARLLNELRRRTADLTEALEQQTATSEVLQAISSSPGQLGPVFEAMLANATQLCDANFGILVLYEEDGFFRSHATHNVPLAFAQKIAELRQRGPGFRPGPLTPIARVADTKQLVHTFDYAEEPAYKERDPVSVNMVELAGARTTLVVPMIKENALIGALSIYRQEVRPFTDKQIELVKNFAAQAVIAIENARLLNELRQRTADLTEALEQQTATADVLQVVSNSPGDLAPIFATMLEKAVRICGASFGNVQRWDGDTLQLVASHNTPLAFAEARQSPYRPDPALWFSRVLTTNKVVQITDATSEKAYLERRNPQFVAAVELAGVRTFLLVPMLMENEPMGVFSLYRQEVRPFTDKQIALVTNFAAQAVIAIENARLLNELRDRTGQLQAQSKELVELNQQLEHRVSDQVGEIERMSRLRRFLPPQVADLIVASGTEKQLESHRREITALFCDLRGFTGFTESADAEDVMALLRDYHAAIGEIIIKYNGTLERYAGDGVMVVFNDPVPVENPALQAVLMALELREAIGALTATWSRLGHEIGFGIGIAHGFATLGTIGFEGRFDYAAIGTVSNVASRLCDEAKPGQILISPRVLTKVENAVQVEPVGEFELKGIRRPLEAYNVLAAKC
jgi:class 3 adenylate cyclase/putative methionine-R-sulfoxide reductase with GAF domain